MFHMYPPLTLEEARIEIEKDSRLKESDKLSDEPCGRRMVMTDKTVTFSESVPKEEVGMAIVDGSVAAIRLYQALLTDEQRTDLWREIQEHYCEFCGKYLERDAPCMCENDE